MTLDVFSRTRGRVVAEVDPAQLRWVRGVLREARRADVDWVVVQGHTPVLGPVRQTGSSGLMYRGGRGSALWRTLVRRDVDLYLAGEVHDVTAIRDRGVTQVSHGGLFGMPDQATRRVRWAMKSSLGGPPLHLAGGRDRAGLADRHPQGGALDLVYDPNPPVVGEMTLTAAGRASGRSGLLALYSPDEVASGARRADPLAGVRE